MSRSLIVACDVDEVCADLLGVWLADYNRKSGDCLLPEDLTDWNLGVDVKPEWREEVYTLLTAEMYDRILPIHGARYAVRQMRQQGHRVIFVSSCPRGTADAKLGWLVKWGFLDGYTRFQKDFIACSDKALIRADVLFDDAIHNVEAFPGMAWLIAAQQNQNKPCSRKRISCLADAPGTLQYWLEGIDDLPQITG